jgi:hypothetical protein
MRTIIFSFDIHFKIYFKNLNNYKKMSETAIVTEKAAPVKKELTDAEKATKLAEAKKKAAERDIQRKESVVSLLNIGVTLKGEHKNTFFKGLSGKKDFQLTANQWKEVGELKDAKGQLVFKPEFLQEIRSQWKFDRATGTSARGKGAGRVANGASIKRSVNTAAMNDEGVIINKELSDAGNRIGEAYDKLVEAFKADMEVLRKNDLLVKVYVRVLPPAKEEETAPTDKAPAPAK